MGQLQSGLFCGMLSPDNLSQPPEWQWQPHHFMGAWLFYCLQFVCLLLVFSVGMLQCGGTYDVSSQEEAEGAWWGGVVAVVAQAVGRDFPDSFAGILSQYIQRDPSADPLRQHIQLVFTAGPSRWSLQSISSGRCVVTSRPSDCWRISACSLRGHGHHVSSHLCCCFLAFNVFLCGHRGSLKSSLELRICDCSLALACWDCLCSPRNAWVCSGLAALLGLFYPFLIASSYRESACIAQAPDTPHPGLFLGSAVPSDFSPVIIPFSLSLLLSP